MNFYDWMISRYLKKDTWRGDLARDMQGDSEFPRAGTRTEIMNHFRNKNACENCITVFKKCWRDYARAGC